MGLRRSLDSIDNEWNATTDGASDVPSAEQGSAPPQAVWKVNVEGREVVGMSAAEIVTKLRSGELSGQSLAWRDGMEDWTALDALPAFALAAPVSSRPAASESRPKAADEVTVKRAPQRTEIGLQPPAAPVVVEAGSAPYEPYEPEDATSVRVLPEVPLDEATVIIREPETLPPPPLGQEDSAAASVPGEDLGALAVYERPIATLAFPEMDAPTDEETLISDPPSESEPPVAGAPAAKSAPPAKAEEPPVPPLPKLPSRALVTTAAAAFLPPAGATRSPSGAPRLSSLGPATGTRAPSPSSPSITRKPLVPTGTSSPPSRPAPLVEALLSLTDKTSPAATATPAAEAAATATPASAAPAAKVSSPPPVAPSAKVGSAPPVAATAKAPSAPPIRVKPETPVVKVEQPAVRADVPRVARQHTPAETPRARASDRPPAQETPTPSVAQAPVASAPVVAVTAPVAPEIPLPADSDPVNEAPAPPPLPVRELAALAANTTPTIILREDRDADTLITNLRLGRSVPLRTAVAAGAVSTVLGSLITGLVVSALSAEPPKAAPPPAAVVTVTAAPPPAPAPEPPKPALEETPQAAPSAPEPSIPSVSARELAAEKVEKKPKKTWAPPKPKVTADPEVALPEDPPSGEAAPVEKKPSTPADAADPAEDKNKAAWETSPSPGF